MKLGYGGETEWMKVLQRGKVCWWENEELGGGGRPAVTRKERATKLCTNAPEG